MQPPPDLDRAGTQGYFLNLPSLESNYSEDIGLLEYLRTIPDIPKDVAKDWERFGRRCVEELDACAKEMELYTPKLEQFEATGQLSNRVVTCSAWKRMKQISAEEGLVSIGYEGRSIHSGSSTSGRARVQESPMLKNSRLHQFVKLHLYNPSSGMYSCPLAMTDGCCKLAVVHTDSTWLRGVFDHCTSCDPAHFWSAGQWMTERRGGSDVSGGTRTVARRVEGEASRFSLYGYKWFSSAADGEVAVTLAKIEGQEKLSCFGVETREGLNKPVPNPTQRQVPPDFFQNSKVKPSIRVVQLKDKLGTHQLPTAELELNGLEATLIGKEGEGIKAISSLLNVTRLYNAASATGFMSRALVRAKSFARARSAFGRPLEASKLHVQCLLQLEAVYRSCLYLVMDAARAFGELECLEDGANGMGGGSGSSVGCSILPESRSKEDRLQVLQQIVRALTPVVKLYTAKHSVQLISECLESMGGLGYLETSELPRLLRDAQVLPVWEGTTNVCALDIVRVFRGSSVLQVLREHYYHTVPGSTQHLPEAWSKTIDAAFDDLDRFFQTFASDSDGKRAIDTDHPLLRELAYSLSRVLGAVAAARVWRQRPSRSNALVVETLISGLSDARMSGLVDARLAAAVKEHQFDLDIAREVVFGADSQFASKL